MTLDARSAASRSDPEAGVRGWLAVFALGAVVATFVRVWAAVALGIDLVQSLARDGIGAIAAASGIAFLVEAVLGLAMMNGLRLMLDRDRRTPSYLGTVLLVSIPGEFIFYACQAYITGSGDATGFGPNLSFQMFDGGGLRGMLVTGVWALYWMRSTRVLRTYGHNAFDKPEVRHA